MKHTWKIALALMLLASPTAGAAPPEPSREPRVEYARTVLAAVVEAAKENHKLPPRGEAGARGTFRREKDELTEYYFREAAAASRKVPAEHAAAAFLLALGVGLDTSDLMRKNPVTRGLWRQIESDDERKRRLAVLGEPTVRGRHDLAQHFVVSCALAAQLGVTAAEAAGVTKELLDAQEGGSGFSFADLSADLAGVEFARRLLASPKQIATVAGSFRVADFTIPPEGLAEGLTQDQFTKQFGGVDDERFLKKLAALRQDVLARPGFKALDQEKGP
jgi:hypothetical protein